MLKKISLLAAGTLLALAMPLSGAMAAGKTFYWVSHGSPADPVWTYFLDGAKTDSNISRSTISSL